MRYETFRFTLAVFRLFLVVILAIAAPCLAQDRSRDLGNTELQVEVRNDTETDVEIAWVDTRGVEHPRGKMPPGNGGVISTVHGHLHIFKVDGRVVGKYAATAEPSQSYTIQGDSKPNQKPKPASVSLDQAKYVALSSNVVFRKVGDGWEQLDGGKVVQRYRESDRSRYLIELQAVDGDLRVKIDPDRAVSNTPGKAAVTLGDVKDILDSAPQSDLDLGGKQIEEDEQGGTGRGGDKEPPTTPNAVSLQEIISAVQDTGNQAEGVSLSVDKVANVAQSGVSVFQATLDLSEKFSKSAKKMAMAGAVVGMAADFIQLFSNEPSDTDRILGAIGGLNGKLDSLGVSISAQMNALADQMELGFNKSNLYPYTEKLDRRWISYSRLLAQASSPNSVTFREAKAKFPGADGAAKVREEISDNVLTILGGGAFGDDDTIFKGIYDASHGDLRQVNAIGNFLLMLAMRGIHMHGSLYAETHKEPGVSALEMVQRAGSEDLFDDKLDHFMGEWKKWQQKCVSDVDKNAGGFIRQWLEDKKAGTGDWNNKPLLTQLQKSLEAKYPGHVWSCFATYESRFANPSGKGWAFSDAVGKNHYRVHCALSNTRQLPWPQLQSSKSFLVMANFIGNNTKLLKESETNFGVLVLTNDRITWVVDPKRSASGWAGPTNDKGEGWGWVLLQ